MQKGCALPTVGVCAATQNTKNNHATMQLAAEQKKIKSLPCQEGVFIATRFFTFQNERQKIVVLILTKFLLGVLIQSPIFDKQKGEFSLAFVFCCLVVMRVPKCTFCTSLLASMQCLLR